MNFRTTMPNEFWQYLQKDGYFFMDHGDVYYGSIEDFDEIPDSIFIVEPAHRRALQALKGKDVTLEKVMTLSRRITDFDKIKYHADGKAQIGNSDDQYDLTRFGNQNWKKMFVFGAGASAFSVFNDEMSNFRKFPYSPPMGNELFGKKFMAHIKKYKGVELSLPSLRAYGNDVEGFFEKEWDEIDTSHNPAVVARHINISYYLKELFNIISSETIREFSDCNLHSLFCNKLQQYIAKRKGEKIAFVSFNYDTILDHYLSQFFSVPLNSMTDYVNFNINPFFLFKPHGSCNWGWKFPDKFVRSITTNIPDFLYNNQISYSDLYFNHLGSHSEMLYQPSWGRDKQLSNNDVGKFSINKNKIEVIDPNSGHYFPSLLIPYKDKDQMIMPYYHFDLMQWYFGSMEDLYLIGWKGNEASFNNLLKTHISQLKRIFIVNPNPAEVEENLSKYIDLKKYEIIYFTDFESFSRSDIN